MPNYRVTPDISEQVFEINVKDSARFNRIFRDMLTNGEQRNIYTYVDLAVIISKKISKRLWVGVLGIFISENVYLPYGPYPHAAVEILEEVKSELRDSGERVDELEILEELCLSDPGALSAEILDKIREISLNMIKCEIERHKNGEKADAVWAISKVIDQITFSGLNN